MKKKWILIFLCFLLSGCGKPVELKKHTFTIELGKDVYANPGLYVKDASVHDLDKMEIDSVSPGIVKNANRFVSSGYDYLLIGEYEFELTKGKETVPFKIKIKDTKPPTITNMVSEVEVLQGTEIDWDSYFHATDLSGVKYSANQEVSPYLGEYDVEVTISDRFGNSVVQPVKVSVK